MFSLFKNNDLCLVSQSAGIHVCFKVTNTQFFLELQFSITIHSRAAIGSFSWSGSVRIFKYSAVGESERKKVGGRGSRRGGGVHQRSEGEGK